MQFMQFCREPDVNRIFSQKTSMEPGNDGGDGGDERAADFEELRQAIEISDDIQLERQEGEEEGEAEGEEEGKEEGEEPAPPQRFSKQERIFSIAGLIARQKRNRLAPETVALLVHLRNAWPPAAAWRKVHPEKPEED